MRTESATLKRNEDFQRSARRNHSTRVASRVEHHTGLTLKPVVLVVGETGGLVFITPVVAMALPQGTWCKQPVPVQRDHQSSDDEDRDPKNPLHWMPVPLPNTTNEKFD